MTIDEGVFRAVGATPTVRLAKALGDTPFALYAKLEMLNPGGSSKDRPALAMLRNAVREGIVRPGTTIVESSSGNLAISLAQFCNYMDLPFICVVDPKTTPVNLRLLRLYNARIEMAAEPDPATGDYLPARLARVQRLLSEIPGSYWPNQYRNAENARSHFETTMPELVASLGRIDLLFVGVSTCGTLSGCSDYVRERGLPTRVVAVDVAGSAVYGRSQGGRRKLPGLGAAIVPPLRPEPGSVDTVTVEERDCVAGCRLLLRRESILAGASSGGVLAAVARCRSRIPDGAVCAVILPGGTVLFCPMGLTAFDLAVADWYVRQAERAGIGLELPD